MPRPGVDKQRSSQNTQTGTTRYSPTRSRRVGGRSMRSPSKLRCNTWAPWALERLTYWRSSQRFQRLPSSHASLQYTRIIRGEPTSVLNHILANSSSPSPSMYYLEPSRAASFLQSSTETIGRGAMSGESQRRRYAPSPVVILICS